MKSYKINKILVPVDFSALSDKAIQTAVAISKRQLASITLMYVVEHTYLYFSPEASTVVGAGSVLQQLLKDANENLGTIAKKLRVNHDIVVNHIVQTGNPADEICRWAFHKRMDLIVNGYSWRFRFARVLHGVYCLSRC